MSHRLLLCGCLLLTSPAVAQTPTAGFSPSWNSLGRVQAPDWYSRARFGIAVQWGVSSVPAQHADYARLMYLPPSAAKNPVWVYHQKHYGDPWQFGYKDLIPYWEARAWRPADLASLFRRAGARYVVVLATDVDNFDLFKSPHQPWNSLKVGPHRDLVGDWAAALKSAGLRWGVAAHHARAWQFLRPSHGVWEDDAGTEHSFDGNLQARDGDGQWWDGLNPQDLYGKPRPGNAFEADTAAAPAPPSAYSENWYKRMSTLVTQFQPDLVWMRSTWPHGDWGLRFAAAFYEQGREGAPAPATQTVLVLRAAPGTVSTAFVNHLDADTAAPPIRSRVWQRELQLARDGVRVQDAPQFDALTVQRTLAETVAGGGNLLLQVALTADGELPAPHREVLEQLGAWLTQCEDALAPSAETVEASAPGVAYLTRPDRNAWYAFVLDWKPGSWVRVPFPTATRARWLGGGEARLQMTADRKHMEVEMPARPPGVGLGVLELVADPK